MENSDSGASVGVVGWVDGENPAIVLRHERSRYDKSAAESTDGRKDGTESVSLLWIEDCEQDKECQPALVYKQEQ